MVNEQPEALRLANELERWLLVSAPTRLEAAAELRRLHEVNAALLEALEAQLAVTDWYEQEKANELASAAIAKAEGRS